MTLASCSKVVLTHSLDNPEPLLSFGQSKVNVNAAIWNHNNQVIACSGNEGKIYLYQSHKGNNLLTLEDETSKNVAINSIAFTSNSQFLASGGNDGIVKIWDLKKRGIGSAVKSHFGVITSTTWNHDDTVVASSSLVGDVVLLNVQSGITVSNFNQKSSQGVKMIKFSPFKKNYLAVAANDGSVTIWDVNARTPSVNFPSAHTSRVSSVAFSTYNDILLCSAGLDKNINFFDIQQKKIVKTLETDSPLISLAFYIDGHTIVAGSLYGSIIVYDLRASSKPKMILKGHENNGVNHLDFIKYNEESRKPVLVQEEGSKSPVLPSSTFDSKQGLPLGQQASFGSLNQISPLLMKTTLNDISNNQNGVIPGPIIKPTVKAQINKDQETLFFNDKPMEKKADFSINPTNNTFGVTLPQKNEEKEKPLPIKNTSGSLLDPHDEFKAKYNTIEEIRKEALLRIESKKKEKTQLIINTNNSSIVSEKNLSKRTDDDNKESPKQRNSKGTAKPKEEIAKVETANKPSEKENFESANRYKPALEEFNRRAQVQLSKIEENEEFSERQKAFLKNTLEENNNNLKTFFHENIQNLHVEIIRQFLIQQNEMSSMLEKYLINQQRLENRIQELQAENASLRKITY